MNESGQIKHQVYLGIGSNIDPQENLPRAVELLQEVVQVEAASRVWRTTAVGDSGPDFLNAALQVKSFLPSDVLKREILRPIEGRLGRVRTENKYAPRTIDLDILIFDGRVLEPQIWKQAFLAVPLSELLPGYTNSDTGETLSHAAFRLSQGVSIEPCPEPDLDCFLIGS